MSEADNVEVAAEATATTEAPVAERPEWLPEKFNTPEDLASSYQSLEQKLGAGQEELQICPLWGHLSHRQKQRRQHSSCQMRH